MKNAKAGPELNAVVAEQVMKWQWFQVVTTAVLVYPRMADEWRKQGDWMYKPLPDGPGKMKRENLDGIFFYDSSRGGHTMPDIPDYSTNITEAFKVVEKVRENPRLGFEVARPRNLSKWRAMFWEADGGKTGGKDRVWSAMADTPAVAICLVALKVAAATA